MMLTTHDDFSGWQKAREIRRERLAFAKVRKAEISYAVQLRKIARHIQEFVSGLKTGSQFEYDEIARILNGYATVLKPWAENVASRMLLDVARRDERAWKEHAKAMGIELKSEILTAPTGQVMQKLMNDQVDLITSLPREAAKRVQKLAIESVYSGTRSGNIVAEIMKTGDVTRSRANLIARTETAKAASTFVQARATDMGSTHYIWSSARDVLVRTSHRKMEGKVIAWDTPPEVEPGKFYHAGQFPNCRCIATPILPDSY